MLDDKIMKVEKKISGRINGTRNRLSNLEFHLKEIRENLNTLSDIKTDFLSVLGDIERIYNDSKNKSVKTVLSEIKQLLEKDYE